MKYMSAVLLKYLPRIVDRKKFSVARLSYYSASSTRNEAALASVEGSYTGQPSPHTPASHAAPFLQTFPVRVLASCATRTTIDKHCSGVQLEKALRNTSCSAGARNGCKALNAAAAATAAGRASSRPGISASKASASRAKLPALSFQRRKLPVRAGVGATGRARGCAGRTGRKGRAGVGRKR